jgi:hypothetical protein
MLKHLLVLGFLSMNLLPGYSQQMKIGVFDMNIMVQVMPSYKSTVDSVLQIYIQDSLEQDYAFFQQEYVRLDSMYRIDSAAHKSKAVLDLKDKQRQQIGYQLMNYEKLAEYKIGQKRAVLARPIYEKVFTAYKKVMDTNKYTLILKPNTYEALSPVDNMFVAVARELNVKLPPELME